MKYILTGKYFNGDEYGDTFYSVYQLYEALHEIERTDNLSSLDDERVIFNSLSIEVEND